WPVSLAGLVLLIVAAIVALVAVWRWDRTRVVVTTEKLFIVHGVLRKQAAAVRLAKVGTVELDQSLVGRLLGYGTIVAGDLEIACVPHPRELCGLVQRLAGKALRVAIEAVRGGRLMLRALMLSSRSSFHATG